ncbi:hypothetical protein [Janibacter massiliensis]|uniref:hypothetical protein n=1 Tax=Janibacter massiliensis TaxID=2058291 RepID=UPI000D0F718D|nr:hypothetical protein [Janibacter massiliensis]
MTDSAQTVVPVWTLTTGEPALPHLGAWDEMTPARLDEMRLALAALAETPVVTLEAHPVPKGVERPDGVPLDALSPLARELGALVSKTATAMPSAVAEQGEVLYRMVVPAKVAAQVGQGLVKPMKAASGGIYSGLLGAKGVTANARFVPVGTSGAAFAGGAAAAGGSAAMLTVAAPLVLALVAAGVTAYAERQRDEAIKRVTELLEKIDERDLDRERSELEGCLDSIDKATAVLLDEGRVGISLGLDSAAHEIGTAIRAARRRVGKWETSLGRVRDKAVEVERLEDEFPGLLSGQSGEFYAHLELAALAIALKRRVIVLQAVEHSQLDASNQFENFMRSLRNDQQSVDELERRIAAVLRGLSELRLRPPQGFLDRMMMRGEVDELLEFAYALRLVGDRVTERSSGDLTIEVLKDRDGSLLVLPAVAR